MRAGQRSRWEGSLHATRMKNHVPVVCRSVSNMSCHGCATLTSVKLCYTLDPSTLCFAWTLCVFYGCFCSFDRSDPRSVTSWGQFLSFVVGFVAFCAHVREYSGDSSLSSFTEVHRSCVFVRTDLEGEDRGALGRCCLFQQRWGEIALRSINCESITWWRWCTPPLPLPRGSHSCSLPPSSRSLPAVCASATFGTVSPRAPVPSLAARAGHTA